MINMQKASYRWFAGCLAFAAVLSSGCQQGQGPSQGKPAAASPSAAQPAAAVDPAKDISLMLDFYNKQAPSSLLQHALEEKTGTRLSITWIPDSVYSDKQLSAFAAGTLPKVVQVKEVDLRKPTIVNAVRAGLFWEIGPYLKDYPNITWFMNETIMDKGAYFGKYYGLYRELPMSRQGIQFRKDWLDKLGLQPPTTVDELYTVLKAFTFGDPDGNGKQDTYGLVDRNDLVYGAFKNIATYMGAPNNWGWSHDKLAPDFMTPEYMNAMKFMKKLYDEGIINPDFSLISKTQQEDRFATGKAGMMITNLLASSASDRLKKTNPDAEVDVINRIKGPNGERVWGSNGLGGLYMFPKTSVKTEEELRGILEFFDKLLTPEVNNLITYGIEGRHYTVHEDGSVKVRPETKELRETEVEDYNTAFRTSDVRFMPQGSQNELIKKINRLVEDNSKIVVTDPASSLVSPTQAEKGDELRMIISDATYNFILGTLDAEGYAREVDRWRRSGGDRIIAEMNQAYLQTK